MAKSYTKLRYFRNAIKRCSEVKLTYVSVLMIGKH